MDAVGSDRATVLGLEISGFGVAAMFAATLPERTAGLIGYATMARELWAPDYPIGVTQEESDSEIAEVERSWATQELARDWVEVLWPAAGNDALEIEDMAAVMRALGGPGDAAISARLDRDIDIRSILPSIRVPTLVIHRAGDLAVPIEAWTLRGRPHPRRGVRRTARRHPHVGCGRLDLPAAVERFVATIHQEEVDLDRYLGTVLFTDIVDSTAMASAAGDRGWRELVERHHHMARGHIARHRGTEMDTAGDGFFATFDGPARAVRCALRSSKEPGNWI